MPIFVQNFHNVTPKPLKCVCEATLSFAFHFNEDRLCKPFLSTIIGEKGKFYCGKILTVNLLVQERIKQLGKKMCCQICLCNHITVHSPPKEESKSCWLWQKCWNIWMFSDFSPMTHTGPHLQLLRVFVWVCVLCLCVCTDVHKTNEFHLYLPLRKLHCTRLLFVQAHTGLGRNREVNEKCE